MDEMYDVAGLHYPEQDEFTRVVLANANYLDIWRREHRILGHFFAAALTDPEMGRIYGEYRAKFERRIAGRLERLIEQGRVELACPDLVAAALSSMVEFTAFRYFFLRDPTIALTHSAFPTARLSSRPFPIRSSPHHTSRRGLSTRPDHARPRPDAHHLSRRERCPQSTR
jgi:hypothetical protein